jgi:hypothetical protein
MSVGIKRPNDQDKTKGADGKGTDGKSGSAGNANSPVTPPVPMSNNANPANPAGVPTPVVNKAADGKAMVVPADNKPPVAPPSPPLAPPGAVVVANDKGASGKVAADAGGSGTPPVPKKP